jgi:membrane fusion protein (multidrug efflux system)
MHRRDILFTINPANFEAGAERSDAEIANALSRITALQADVRATRLTL